MKSNSKSLKYMPLYEGEQIQASVEGNAYNFSTHPLLALLGFITRLIALLTGTQSKIHLMVTDARVITVETKKILWVLDGSVNARTYTPRSITQIGYSLGRSFLIFKGHYLDYVSGSVGYKIKAKGGKDNIFRTIDALVELPEKVEAANKA